MHKRNIFKIILILISVIFILHFQFKVERIGFLFLIPVLFLLTSYMYKCKNKIKKYKFIYDVILMLLMFFSGMILLFITFNIPNLINGISIEPVIILLVFGGLYLLLKLFIDSIITRNEQNDKINDYLIIITFLIINLVFIRYYLDIKSVIPGNIESAHFIQQNYIYFLIMMLVIELHKYINKKFLRMN